MSKRAVLVLAFLFLVNAAVFGKSGRDLARELDINPATKAIIQWERYFSNPKRLKRLGADKLNPQELQALKEYLIQHAADSDQPAAAGI